MNEATKDFLKKIGVPTSTIEAISAEETENVNVEELASSFRSNLKSLASNDPELIKGIRDEIRGTELSKIEHRIKKTFDLSSEEVKDKKFEEILEAAHAKAIKEAGSSSEELQSKIVELNNKVKQYEEEILPSAKQEASQKIAQFRRDLALQTILSKKNLIVGNEVVLPALNSKLNEYKIEVTESGEIEVKTKDGLKPLNTDGTKTLSFEDIIDQQLSSMNVIKQSNGSPTGDPKPGANPNPSGGNEDEPGEAKFELPGMKKARHNAEGLKEMKTFGGGQQ